MATSTILPFMVFLLPHSLSRSRSTLVSSYYHHDAFCLHLSLTYIADHKKSRDWLKQSPSLFPLSVSHSLRLTHSPHLWLCVLYVSLELFMLFLNRTYPHVSNDDTWICSPVSHNNIPSTYYYLQNTFHPFLLPSKIQKNGRFLYYCMISCLGLGYTLNMLCISLEKASYYIQSTVESIVAWFLSD